MAARYTIAESPFQRMLSYVTTVILWFLGFVFSVVVFWFSRMFVARQLLNVTDVGQRATTGKLCKLSPGGNQKEWWTVEVSDLWQLWSQVVQFLKVNSSIQKSHLCLCPYVTVHHLPYTMTLWGFLIYPLPICHLPICPSSPRLILHCAVYVKS